VVNEIDFLDLYRQLRVSPDCGLQEFKQAYRRRVSTLHPDREPHGYARTRVQRLQQLNEQYEAAMEFQRLHGRLPGAQPPTRTVTPQRANPLPRTSPAPLSSARPRPNMKWLIPIALVAIGILFWSVSAVVPQPDGTTDNAASDNDASPTETPAAPMLAVGMSPENVRAIQGDPVAIRDDLWEYGPSWVRFDHGSLVDWYSSPLHALKTTRTRPSAARN
jgi:DnaJ domain